MLLYTLPMRPEVSLSTGTFEMYFPKSLAEEIEDKFQ